MIQTLAFFITSFVITYFAIPSVIKVAKLRNLFDEPDERKLHKKTIPALGGVAIFAGIFFSVLFWTESFDFNLLRWIVLSLVIIFLLGLKDDIVAIDPLKKLIGQVIAAGLIIVYGDVRIQSFHGLLGVQELPYLISVVFSLFVFIVIINAFNLIDGIDGLAGGIGTIASLTFGGLFLYIENYQFASISFATAGSLLAFLRYNFAPAKIFMGDGGALVIGFLLSLLCIKFLNANIVIKGVSDDNLSTPLMALAILIIPLVDTFRSFTIRIINKNSPFTADRNHVHHLLLDLGLGHRQSSLTLYVVNFYFIALTIISINLGAHAVLFLIIFTAFVFSQIPSFLISSRNKQVNRKQKHQAVV